MCRLLFVRSDKPFPLEEHLRPFAELSKASKEYQGHGWGFAALRDGSWDFYRNIDPIWEDDHTRFGEAPLLIAHARSAFQDEGIVIENNMPFSDDTHVFIFNGELRGVRVKESGRIGAEKIFNYIKRFDKGDFSEALERGVQIIRKKSRYVRAMNIIVTDGVQAFVSTEFNEDQDYFQMYKNEQDPLILCSDPYPGSEQSENWVPLENGTVEVY